MKTRKTICTIRPGLGLAKSSKNPTPDPVKKTACKNWDRASQGILSEILPALAKEVRRMLSEDHRRKKGRERRPDRSLGSFSPGILFYRTQRRALRSCSREADSERIVGNTEVKCHAVGLNFSTDGLPVIHPKSRCQSRFKCDRLITTIE